MFWCCLGLKVKALTDYGGTEAWRDGERTVGRVINVLWAAVTAVVALIYTPQNEGHTGGKLVPDNSLCDVLLILCP